MHLVDINAIQYPQNPRWLKDHVIFLTLAGSHSYNTDIEGSDVDLKGVATLPPQVLFGFTERFEQAQGKEPYDFEVFSLLKFAKLAYDNNPNILELLFVDESSIVLTTPQWERMRTIRHKFLSKKIAATFAGYAKSQLKKIRTHRGYLLNPRVTIPTREAFGLPERSIVPKLHAADAAVTKLLDTVAGGALMKGPINDIDIWPSPWCVEPYQTYIKNKLRGRNFCEEIVGGLKVQLCQAPVCNVEDLVSGFDFAHCKVGASISVDPDGHATALAFVHPDFIASMAVQGTFYSPGHRWPLHSLARLGKVCNKLGLSVVESKDLGNQIMSDLLRGGLEQAANKDPDYIKWLKDYGMPIQSTTPCTTSDTDPAEIDPFSALGAFGQSKTSPRP
jgi:hypothetical protein